MSYTIETHGIGRIEILKNPDPVFLLQFIVQKALESNYGSSDELIEFSRESIYEWLKPYGITKEGLIREAIEIGHRVGWLDSVSLTQLTGVIKGTKPHISSIQRTKGLSADFFRAIEEPEDVYQTDLFGFDDDEMDIT